MIKVVKELKQVMKKHSLSVERTSRYLDCSLRSIIRWLADINAPTGPYRRKIQLGIAKIRLEYETDSIYDLSLKARTLYRKIQRYHVLDREEKAKLQDINIDEGVEAYITALEALVEKHKPDTRQREIFPTK